MTSADTIKQLRALKSGKSVTVTLVNATSQEEANYINEVTSSVDGVTVTPTRKGLHATITFTKVGEEND